MHYDERIYRPPQEAFTPLLQVTSGCSHNKCTFCNMYRDISFRVSPLSEIEADIEELRSCNPNFDRIYLVNGDPFVLNSDRLEKICRLIKQYLPRIRVISMYASVKNIALKSLAELKTLQTLGVNDLYIGLESGSDQVLAAVNKASTATDALQQLGRLQKAGIRYYTIIMTGLGGRGRGVETAMATAALLNQLQPRGVLCTSTVVMPGTTLHRQKKTGQFQEASEYERVLEIKTLLERLDISGNVLFNSTHNSNNLPLNGVLPRHREILLEKCREILEHYTEEEFQKVFDRNNRVIM